MAENMSVPVPITNQPLARLSRVEYMAMCEKGAFQGRRVELVFGLVVEMNRPAPEHVESTHRLHEILQDALRGRARVLCQMPIAATDDSMPQPDIYVTPRGDYWHEHATRAHLVIEVSNSSLAYDRGEKSLLYGISDVEEYWIVDLVHELVEVRREPDGGTWRMITTHRRGETIRSLAFPDVEVEVAQILPPPRQ
jgi:Uma2 family endonuclease